MGTPLKGLCWTAAPVERPSIESLTMETGPRRFTPKTTLVSLDVRALFLTSPRPQQASPLDYSTTGQRSVHIRTCSPSKYIYNPVSSIPGASISLYIEDKRWDPGICYGSWRMVCACVYSCVNPVCASVFLCVCLCVGVLAFACV